MGLIKQGKTGKMIRSCLFKARQGVCEAFSFPWERDLRQKANKIVAFYPLSVPDVPPGSIIIVRHGKSALNRDVWITGKGYRLWWQRYDGHGLAQGQTVPQKLMACAQKADTFFSSPLPRALETAEAIFGKKENRIITDALFVEAPLPSPLWPLIRLKPIIWGAIARVAWCCGWSDGMETETHARKRAHAAAQRLTQRAARGERVFLTAHGWFNRMLRPELKRMGWSCLYDGGDGYWSFRVYGPKHPASPEKTDKEEIMP